MLHCYCGVLGVGHQLACGFGLAAHPLENLKMVWARANNACRRALYQRGHKRKCLVEGGGWLEHSWIGDDANEPRQDEYRKGKGLRPRRHTGNPSGVFAVLRGGVFYMGIDQDVDVGKQHFNKPSPTPEPIFVV